MNYNLSQATTISGHSVSTLEDAAYLIRQDVIANEDVQGRRVVHFLRDADCPAAAAIAENKMRDWLSIRSLRSLAEAMANLVRPIYPAVAAG